MQLVIEIVKEKMIEIKITNEKEEKLIIVNAGQKRHVAIVFA